MNHRISVIMGIYNCANTLHEALDSLYSQTYKDFKIILCDDGSTDNTFDVAKRYADSHNNIVLLRNEKNIKLAATLNRCLDYADTEYVARMDGDDISLPTRFEKEINFLNKHPEYALVSCAMIYFDETGDFGLGKPLEKPTKLDFRTGTPFAHAPCMIRTNVIKDVDGYTVNKKLVRGQDYYLWYKIYKKGYKGYNLQEPLYKMRDDKNALTRRKFKDRLNFSYIKYLVLKDFKIKFPLYYSFIDLSKAFVPLPLMSLMHRIRLKNKNLNN